MLSVPAFSRQASYLDDDTDYSADEADGKDNKAPNSRQQTRVTDNTASETRRAQPTPADGEVRSDEHKMSSAFQASRRHGGTEEFRDYGKSKYTSFQRAQIESRSDTEDSDGQSRGRLKSTAPTHRASNTSVASESAGNRFLSSTTPVGGVSYSSNHSANSSTGPKNVARVRPHRDIAYNPSKADFEKARQLLARSAAKNR